MKSLSERLLKDVTGEVRFNEPLKRHTTYRIGGPAEILVLPSSESDVICTLRLSAEHGVPVYVMGSGSNLLVSDEGIRGVVLRLGHWMGQITIAGESVRAQAGASLPKLAKVVADHGLAGLEWAGGVPGTVGGAVAMNAGAHGSDTSRCLTQSFLVTRDGEPVTRSLSELKFSYRKSGLLREEHLVVLAAEFRLRRDDPEAVLARMKGFAARRRCTQPLGMPSSGSVFKNPPGDYAGRLIEACSLKGKKIGGAQVSTVHGNFIVNTGNARARDVYGLINLIRRRVKEEFDIDLEPEVELVGWDEN